MHTHVSNFLTVMVLLAVIRYGRGQSSSSPTPTYMYQVDNHVVRLVIA